MARRDRAFTLIELLVVIAIIAILAAVLFPVFSSAKAKSLQTRCCNNIRQLCMALLAYADDWQGTLPGLNAFGDVYNPNAKDRGPVWKYVRSREVLVCPERIWTRQLGQPSVTHKLAFTYTINGYMTIAERDRAAADRQGERLSKSRNPGKTILLVDENCDESKNEGKYIVNDALFIWEDRTGDRHPGSEHLTTINGARYLCSGVAPVGYLDTHIGIVPGLIKWNNDGGLFHR
ncbi:MAG: prepilin-type N-terminal cleavage/methylation domain-containing protein [Armatimonadota bacterium]